MSATYGDPLIKRAADCPARAKHTATPDDYLSRADWFERKTRTHVQRRCATCGLWVIWIPKSKRRQSNKSNRGAR